MYHACNTVQFPDWLNSQNQVFSLVKTMSSISWSLHDLSQQDFNHTRSLHIYMSHTSQVCGRTLKHTLFEIVYEAKKEPQN